nr:lipoyl(octanoyl) transferase LipB [Geomonas sp. Red32]
MREGARGWGKPPRSAKAPTKKEPMQILDLGTISFTDAFAFQERKVAEVADGGEDTLLLLEHEPIYTIGSAGSLDNLLDPAIDAVRINRGGDVTYHGPGQLVGYPIIALSRRGRDLHRYLRFLEEFLVEVAGEFGVPGHTVAGRTGVWSQGGKIASIGVGVRRWVSMHGFCLNVGHDVSAFRRINPCGMEGCPITSLSRERGDTPPMDQVKALVAERFHPRLDSRLPRC